jgi:solute carrier family 45 protein 1/2/4
VSDCRSSCSFAILLTHDRPWALACWAPFTFMGVEISKLGSSLPTTRRGSHHYQRAPGDSIEMTSSEVRNAEKPDDSASGELAGIYLGILNLYTTLPQFVATGISTVVFTVLEPGKSPELAKDAHPDEHHSTDGYNGIAVCLFIGAFCSVGAAVATQRFKNTA